MAVARVVAVEPDLERSGFSYARVDSFLPLDDVVPLEGPAGAYEAIVRQAEPSRRGVALRGRLVRTIEAADFAAIVRVGLRETLSPANARRLELGPTHADAETLALVEQERRIEQMLSNRKIRDAAFRRQVIDAYDGRCAVTGSRLINGGGKVEAQAAHIWSVADGGPDIVQKGIARSATAHWLFDRHLIALTDDFALLVSHNKVPAELRTSFARQMQRVHLPTSQRDWPYLPYVRRHRDRFAAGAEDTKV